MHGPDAEIIRFLESCGVREISLNKVAELERIRELVLEANRETNLTRILDEEEFWIKHVADSLTIGLILPELAESNLIVADVGCGAGFPVLPLAWAFPKLRLTGIDAKPRRIEFVNRCCKKFGWTHCLGLPLQAREAGRQPRLAHGFDLIISRAMGECHILMRECRELLKPGSGRLVLYKTPGTLAAETPGAEREAKRRGYTFHCSETLQLPRKGGTRQFAIFAPSP